MSHPHHTHTDPRDHLIPAEEVNATPHYVMYSVFRTAGPLRDPDAHPKIHFSRMIYHHNVII